MAVQNSIVNYGLLVVSVYLDW